MKLVYAVALCALPFVLVATASATACATKADLLQQVGLDNPQTGVVIVDGEMAARVARGIARHIDGAVPAGGDYALIHLPQSGLTYVVRFDDGCATHHGRFPTALVEAWLSGALEGSRDD